MNDIRWQRFGFSRICTLLLKHRSDQLWIPFRLSDLDFPEGNEFTIFWYLFLQSYRLRLSSLRSQHDHEQSNLQSWTSIYMKSLKSNFEELLQGLTTTQKCLKRIVALVFLVNQSLVSFCKMAWLFFQIS